MDNPGPGGYIPGVYNYCDRWCERCPLIERCLLYARERIQRERHEGEEDDRGIFAASLPDTRSSLLETADVLGIDPDVGREWAPEELDPEKDPTCRRAVRWGDRLEALLERLREDLTEILESLLEEAEGAGEDQDTNHAAAIGDADELLQRYRHFVPLKVIRALESEWEARQEDGPDLASFSRDDARGTAKLADECLRRCVDALWGLAELDTQWRDEAIACAVDAEGLRRAMEVAVPGFRAFRRPGLDD